MAFGAAGVIALQVLAVLAFTLYASGMLLVALVVSTACAGSLALGRRRH